jgi:uroporphyrinogen decarboxylase
MIDGFLEAGIDILDPCQPECMDVFALKRRYGKVLTFHGGIGVQSVLPNGTPDEVKDMVRRTIDIMNEGGGYLCSSSHSLGQDIPWQNILAFVEAVREYGHP